MIEKLITFMLTGRNNDEEGATAVEYGLMVALIAIAIIAAVTLLGGNLATLFDSIAGKL
jgi:pilus assembly protein Flp/PilA